MTTALKIAAVVVVGTLVGLFATWFSIFHHGMPGSVSDGPWRTSLSIGSAQSDPVTRASVAVHGLLALNRRETIYYTAETDQDGQTLDGRCRYAIAGRDPDTRWWSVTAYGADDYLIPNPANRYSVSMTTVSRAKDGTFAIAVGGADAGANWIPPAAAISRCRSGSTIRRRQSRWIPSMSCCPPSRRCPAHERARMAVPGRPPRSSWPRPSISARSMPCPASS